MSLAYFLTLFGYSMLGALVPVLPVEAGVAAAAAKLGTGIMPTVIVSLTAASGTMLGKLQVYAIARGGRSLGGRWLRRRAEREAAEALTKAAELVDEVRTEADMEIADLDRNPDRPHPLRRRAWARLKQLVTGPSMERLGAPAVLVSGVVGIPPFAVVAAVAGAGRMNWVVFFVSGLLGRTVRFALVYVFGLQAIELGIHLLP